MKITFFNHFHRGDLFTHKEFIRRLMPQLLGFEFEYWHYNHPKVNADLQVPLTNTPQNLDNNVLFYVSPDKSQMFINTWIGVHSTIFAKYGGVNLQSLYESWGVIYQKINEIFETNVKLTDKPFDYMPWIDFSAFDLDSVNEWLGPGKKAHQRVLICNGQAMSNQSFNYSMDDMIREFAMKFPETQFICTQKFDINLDNVFFTDDIIKDNSDWPVKPFWVNREKNNCDLNEISYLSRHCDLIIGKNSGPFVFCETKHNYLDKTKHIISFSKGAQESMSNGVTDMRCKYSLITDHSEDVVKAIIEKAFWDHK